MNETEINRLLAEFMGHFKHDVYQSASSIFVLDRKVCEDKWTCRKCGSERLSPELFNWQCSAPIPLYTSTDSPRRLLDEAEAKAIEVVGPQEYGWKLLDAIYLNLSNDNEIRRWSDQVKAATATPMHRCLAVIEACGLKDGI